jgi:hypothetical protein
MSEAGNLRVSSSGGDFIRPASKFNRDNLFGKVTIVIDDKLADDFQSSDWSVEDVGRKYRHYVTGEMATNDT